MPIRQLRLLLGNLFFLLLIICVTTPAFAIEPIQVAILPLVNTTGYRHIDNTQVIQNVMQQPFKYPYYSMISPETIQQATKTYLADNKNPHYYLKEKSLAQLANTLSADLVIVVELSSFQLDSITTFLGDDTYIKSGIELNCYTYSAYLNRYNVIRVAKYDQEPESIDTNSEVIFKNLTEQILAKLPYKRIPLAGFEKAGLPAEKQLPE